MAYAKASAGRPAARRPASHLSRIRRTRRCAAGRAILTTTALVAACVLTAAACIASISLAARSVLRSGMPATVAAAIRADADRDFADRINRSRRMAEIPAQAGPTPERQRAGAESGPARACGGVLAAARAPSPIVADVARDSSAFAGPPCLTGGELQVASLLPAAGFIAAQPPAPVLAMAVPVAPDERELDPARDHTGSLPPTAALPPAPKPQPRRDEGYPESLAVLDGRTAVYDIVAKTVYLPDGTRLEAHSGFGPKKDDPRYVHVRMHGATPPNIYDLREREALFHGVRAIRMTPVERGKMFGRDGILAHSYLLGPNGQSNGCVSFRDYDAFLHAFLRGEVKRMVVVARLPAPPTRAMLRGVRGDLVAMNEE
jgi:hypothetical protein